MMVMKISGNMIKMRLNARMKIVVSAMLLLHTKAHSPEVASRALRNTKLMKFEKDLSSLAHLERQKRFFMFFTMLSYPNDPCKYDETRNGTCMEESECRDAGGTSRAHSYCGRLKGANLGICCLLHGSCGNTVSKRNNTFFVNPDHPKNTTTSQICDLTVPTNDACFIRLDFFDFQIHPPVHGNCVADRFYIPELSRSIPMLCGYNNDTHMYLDVNGLQKITLRIALGQWRGDRKWTIKIARISCWSDAAPPRGCLQYFRKGSGFIRSFNYNDWSPKDSSQIAGFDYTACVRREAEKCYTVWSSEFFSLSSSNNTKDVAVTGDSCSANSKVIIAEGYDISARNITFDRFCGGKLSALAGSRNSSNVYTSSTPFQVRVKTARSFLPERLGKGFVLHYQQLQCLDPPVSGITRHENYDPLAWLEKFQFW
ncbi:hypothetical protein BIW11_11742 [Tropilaelaps mercedesae]|uniref:CUB domain-containing protein n=1 Tax=Tropilaelaps mercedesae TaxID=418985 RepID=A0A1V9X9N6_9ACAR|nr:hypothetical protein BIW11_11742 [Tropilaelaps mercedesae]